MTDDALPFDNISRLLGIYHAFHDDTHNTKIFIFHKQPYRSMNDLSTFSRKTWSFWYWSKHVYIYMHMHVCMLTYNIIYLSFRGERHAHIPLQSNCGFSISHLRTLFYLPSRIRPFHGFLQSFCFSTRRACAWPKDDMNLALAGHLLLKDAANLFYWADRHMDMPSHSARERPQLDR